MKGHVKSNHIPACTWRSQNLVLADHLPGFTILSQSVHLGVSGVNIFSKFIKQI